MLKPYDVNIMSSTRMDQVTSLFKKVFYNRKLYKISTVENTVTLSYRGSNIVEYNHEFGAVTLDTCGYRTNTTKKCMNSVLTMVNFKGGVYQKSFNWYITVKGNNHSFRDGWKVFTKNQ